MIKVKKFFKQLSKKNEWSFGSLESDLSIILAGFIGGAIIGFALGGWVVSAVTGISIAICNSVKCFYEFNKSL